MVAVLILVLVAALAALGFAFYNFSYVKKMDEGTNEMKEIAEAIRIGANAFINYEYKILYVVVVIVAIIMGVITQWQSGAALILGSVMSGCAGMVGMKIATYANVRVSNKARETRKLGPTLQVAFRGGSVMGLCVAGFALLGLFIVFMVFGVGMKQLTNENFYQAATNWMGVSFIPFTMTVSSYALGCSIVAMFNRVGGGIYTKAADMGADLVGKTEAHIPEDDPRNPATIADNVGDNVGDVAGLGSDLLESYMGAISSVIILAFNLFATLIAKGSGEMATSTLRSLYLYPVAFCALGLISCVLGIAWLLNKKNVSDFPHKELNSATYVSAGLTLVLGLIVTFIMFSKDANIASYDFKLGWISPWIGGAIGLISGVVIGMIAEFYTSADYNPTKIVAAASQEGPALTITQGLALGMKSCMAPCIILGLGIVIAYYVSGMYGVAMAAAGMLSFVAATVSVDTYGPISDNAGGIAEMSHLDHDVRNITDTLDSVGNTTAAIGKGFAIGSGALAALALMISYLYSYNDPTTELTLNVINPLTLAGVIIGGALPFLFSGMLIEAVAKAARKMVDEVRRQFKTIPGILEGKAKPDYKTCIEISSKGAISEMRVPALLAIIIPVAAGFIAGPEFVGGILIGSTICSIMIAIFAGNAGGAWDNGKKYIETGAIKGQGKGTPTHDAAVVGDTVGDPLKDTVGPCLDIFIKIMSTVSLVAVAVFSQYNLFNLFK